MYLSASGCLSNWPCHKLAVSLPHGHPAGRGRGLAGEKGSHNTNIINEIIPLLEGGVPAIIIVNNWYFRNQTLYIIGPGGPNFEKEKKSLKEQLNDEVSDL